MEDYELGLSGRRGGLGILVLAGAVISILGDYRAVV